MAEHSDRRIAAGDARPLEGLPVGVKDLFCTEGIATTAGSRILEGFVPPYESTVTARLWDAGAVLIGKTNLDEFAMGSSTVTSYFEPTINPWTPAGARRAPGAGRQLGRLDRGGRSAALPGRDRHRYRRLDPPAGGALRRGRHEAYLWPLLALWHRRVRELARPGRPDRPHGRGLRAAAAADGGLRSQGQHQRRPAARRSFGGPERRCPRPAGRHPQGVPAGRHAARDRRHSGSRASTGCRPPAAGSPRSACRTPNMHCPPTTSWHRPRRPRTSRATTACASACGSKARTCLTPMPGRARRASARRCAGA